MLVACPDDNFLTGEVKKQAERLKDQQAGAKKNLCTAGAIRGFSEKTDYFFAARSKEATISALAASALSQPSTFTHLPFSRSL